MPPSLPPSLSPHICILHSPDLEELLGSASLPLLPPILQSFSPLSQVTTRTTSLISVPHAVFPLRFSDLVEVEISSHEDEEQRAGRTMDWIGTRVGGRCARWVELVEASPPPGKENPWKDRTPWWEEVKRCVEGDNVPNRVEGWNHPVAVIYAVSTLAVNPLQVLQDLHARTVDLPPWVDGTFLRYSLIVHPTNSPLADPIAESLFNAVKKQYGLHSYLLNLDLPTSPLPQPVPIPYLAPRLPHIQQLDMASMPPSRSSSATLLMSPNPGSVMSPMPRSPGPLTLNGEQIRHVAQTSGVNSLMLCDPDIQQLGKFVREFLVMSLIPWMEKCVIDWNEIYSSSRRLPSRLFSSTRRLFGSSNYTAPSPPSAPSTPSHGSSPSISSVNSRTTSHAPNSSISSLASISSNGGPAGTVSQQRRLAEFATILGDYKLAITVWEALRKESKGGSDVLPLLLSPGPAIVLLAANAIQAIHTQFADSPALAQLRALAVAIRWDISIDSKDFLGNVLEGDRWLVQAAGTAEEPPTALLLSHAAFLSVKKNAKRRASLWYLSAADRLDKIGIKPLAMYFFRKSHQLYLSMAEKELSPSFWDSEGKDPADWKGFDSILPGINHELGRLLYTTGDTEGAVRNFLNLLGSNSRPTVLPPPPTGLGLSNGNAAADNRPPSRDKVYLEDFRVALKHFRTTEPERCANASLHLPLKFCQPKHTKIRLPGDAMDGDPEEWGRREESWNAFWKPQGKETLEKGGRAGVDETFWVDLFIRNPLDTEVTLSALTLVVCDSKSGDPIPDVVEVEVVDDVSLNSRESRTIPIAVKASRPVSVSVINVTYQFLSLLPATESLAIRGRRLHDTPLQRQTPTYAPDIILKVEVEDAAHRLQATFVDDRHLVLAQGEYKRMSVWLTNSGKRDISEIWLVPGSDDEVWLDTVENTSVPTTPPLLEIPSTNSLAELEPFRIPLESIHSTSSLAPGEKVMITVVLHANGTTEQDLCILFVFREDAGDKFHSTRLVRRYETRQILETSARSRPSCIADSSFIVNLEIASTATSAGIQISQVMTVSPTWTPPSPEGDLSDSLLAPHQASRLTFGVSPCDLPCDLIESTDFVKSQLRSVFQGASIEPLEPPRITLRCRNLLKSAEVRSVDQALARQFINCGRRITTASAIQRHHPYIPSSVHQHVFPLYHPHSLDIVIFWEIPSQERSGHILLSGLILGAGHASLAEVISEAENMKVKRSMYAETTRQRAEILQSARTCEWNAEMNPINVSVESGTSVEHDFTKGPCRVPVTFTLRNHSLTNPARFRLKLSSSAADSLPSMEYQSSQYVGRLTHRGELAPSQSTTLKANILASRPGNFALNGWRVETEVGERPEHSAKSPPSAGAKSIDDSGAVPWKTRHRYEQGPQAGDRACITVVDIHS